MDDYEAAYGETDSYFGPRPAPLLTRFAPELKPAGRVLDLGVGQGRNALPLAAAGMRVTGIDPSSESIAQTGRLASEAGVTLELRQVGFPYFTPPEPFETVLCFGLLQILSRAEIDDLFRRLQEWIAPGGLLLLVAWHVDDPSRATYEAEWDLVGRHCFRGPHGDHRSYLEHGEILDRVAGWKILHHEELMGPVHRHGDGPEHRHGDVELVAERQ